MTFTNLTPGRLYNITLWTVSGGVTSAPLVRQDRLHPESVSNINATEVKDTEISLFWSPPKGDWDSFEVEYLDHSGRLLKNSTPSPSITIGGLRPFRNYTFTVTSVSGTLGPASLRRRSAPVSAVFQTRESVPGSLNLFEPFEVRWGGGEGFQAHDDNEFNYGFSLFLPPSNLFFFF